MHKLKKIRLEKGLTQLQVQMKTGIDQSDYSKIERGLRYPTWCYTKKVDSKKRKMV